MNIRTVLCAGTIALLCSCRSTHTYMLEHDHAELLAYVPEDERSDIEKAREQRAEIASRLAAARRDLAEVESLQELAEANVDATETRLDEAIERVTHARRYDDADELREAEQRREEFHQAMRLHEAKAAYYDDLRELAERRVDLVEARMRLWDVRVELQTAEAVSRLDRPAARDVDVAAHRIAAERVAADVEEKRLETLVARHRADLRSEFVKRCSEGVTEALRMQPLEKPDAVFATKVAENEVTKFELDRDRRDDGR